MNRRLFIGLLAGIPAIVKPEPEPEEVHLIIEGHTLDNGKLVYTKQLVKFGKNPSVDTKVLEGSYIVL